MCIHLRRDYITETNISINCIIINFANLRDRYFIKIEKFPKNCAHNFYANLKSLSINFDNFINNDTSMSITLLHSNIN